MEVLKAARRSIFCGGLCPAVNFFQLKMFEDVPFDALRRQVEISHQLLPVGEISHCKTLT